MTDSDEQRPMEDLVAASARATAVRLAAECEQPVVAAVERALYERDLPRAPEQYLDPISLGGLILSIATLAWSVYADLRSTRRRAPAEIIERKMRVSLRSAETIDPHQRDRIVAIVVEETLRLGEEQDR